MSNDGPGVNLWNLGVRAYLLVITDLVETNCLILLRQPPQSAPGSPSKASDPHFIASKNVENGRTGGRASGRPGGRAKISGGRTDRRDGRADARADGRVEPSLGEWPLNLWWGFDFAFFFWLGGGRGEISF